MTDMPPSTYCVAVRQCTLHAGRFRWEIRRGGEPVPSSPNSYVNEMEALRAGTDEILRLQAIAPDFNRHEIAPE
jgi:hypothetical protein